MSGKRKTVSHSMQGVFVFVLLGLLRYLQKALVDQQTGDPTRVLLTDRFTQLVVAAWVVSFLVLIYL